MIDTFLKSVSLITNKQKIIYYFLCFLSTVSIFFDLIGIALIPIFVAYFLETNMPFESLNFFLNFIENSHSGNKYIFFISIIFSVYFLKFFFSLSVAYIFERFNKEITYSISAKLYNGYLFLPYSNYFDLSSSLIQRNIIMEVKAVFRALMNFSQIFKGIVMIVFIIVLFILNENNDFFFILSLMLFFTISFYLFLKKTINKISLKNQIIIGELLRNVSSTVDGIKEVILGKKYYFFLDHFNRKHQVFLKNNLIINFITKIPTIVLELIIIMTVLGVLLFLIEKNLSAEEIIVSITFLSVASIRLAPNFSSITISINSLNNLKPSIDLVRKEMFFINKNSIKLNSKEKYFGKNILNIKFNNISFNYPDRNEKIIDKLNLEFKNGELVGVAGKTGSGKSTFINLLAGLLKPKEGNILINNLELNENEHSWHSYISYVSQEIFLLEDTIANNITFGVKDNEIDYKKLEKVIECCELNDFIKSLPNGLETNVGNNAIKISGGQKQRIGIARALYLNRDILVLDEATNSLDIHIENKILENIKKIYDEKIIFMISHSIRNFKKSSKIILFENKLPARVLNDYKEFTKEYIN
tara:strand:- start:9787 stop:11547 length:1761 start_codon:yes stop_codon:yes gene_type:complete